MVDVRVAELAARQHNRFSLAQVSALGLGDDAIRHRLARGRWVAVHEGVFAIAPPLADDRGRWMAATLTAPGSVLSHASAGAAWGWWTRARGLEIVTRPGSGGPRRIDGVLVHRSAALAREDVLTLDGIPITGVPRTLLDLAPHIGNRLLARCVREAIRLRTTTAAEIIDALAGRHRGRRGSRRLAATVARYTGLPVHRARSGAEVAALEILRDAGRPAPDLNRRIAGEEADLSWPACRLIVEIDGGQYHLDAGEDARKTEVWERAGFTVRRLPAEVVVDDPQRLLALAPNVQEQGP
jgi:hypothetical protein